MISLELVALEPYENGELKPHTAGIIREIEEKNEIFEEEDKFERVEIRRGLEIRLVHKYDKTTINARRECWFLMDTRWLNQWAEYVENKEDAEPPGRVSTKDLRDEEGKVLPNLTAKIDYRGVPPTVYFIFKELYGKDETSPICRYTVDIYNMPVPDDHYIKIIKGPMEKARIMVNKCRTKYVKWGEEIDDGEDDWCCCGLTMDHVESILYWVLTCGKRGRSGRDSIKYTDYKPLKRTKGDGDDLSEWSMRSNSTLGSMDSSASSSASIGHADQGYGQDGLVRNWVMGMVGYAAT